MVDILALAVSHGLLALACWRLLWRADLDQEGDAPPRRRHPRREMITTQSEGEDD
ncbi:hypothetical protein WSK_3035 [Novosphingobium sp. Rr 2-17]|nr:hypothetical protein WSK_3035 [Novosphingobium sp. Rr 2-17]